jgi:putative transposon-encoded protein
MGTGILMSGNEYDGLETSDEIIEAIENIASGRACDENSAAWNVWQSPKQNDYKKIEKYLDEKYPNWRKEGLLWGWGGKWTGETHKFTLHGYEVLEKTVKPHATSAHVGLPKNWIGCRVAVIRLDEGRNPPNPG